MLRVRLNKLVNKWFSQVGVGYWMENMMKKVVGSLFRMLWRLGEMLRSRCRSRMLWRRSWQWFRRKRKRRRCSQKSWRDEKSQFPQEEKNLTSSTSPLAERTGPQKTTRFPPTWKPSLKPKAKNSISGERNPASSASDFSTWKKGLSKRESLSVVRYVRGCM